MGLSVDKFGFYASNSLLFGLFFYLFFNNKVTG